MIQVFRGDNPHFQQQYTDIKHILHEEHCIQLSSSMASDIYIYWCNPDYFASGCVRFALQEFEGHYQFILRNLAFHIDYKAYERELDYEDYEGFDAQLGGQFFKAIYLTVYDMVKHQSVQFSPHGKERKQSHIDLNGTLFPTLSSTQILMELCGEELIDCVNLGYWPCSEEKEFAQAQYRTILSLTPQDRKSCLNNLQNLSLSDDEEEGE